jgi:hypothetical protein
MAVSISIKDYSEAILIVFEDNDPIYWFLFPYFEETWREVGQMVDLYGDAEFFAEELLAFFLILEKAENDARSRDQELMVTVGYRHGNGQINKPITKSAVIDRIESLKEMVNHAYNIDRKVVCFGD